MAPVIKALQQNKSCQVSVCSTGQHKDMVQQAMDIFNLNIDNTLEVMSKGQSLAALTSKLYDQLDKVVLNHEPDWVLIHGDTTSAMVGSMVAYYHRCKVAHIEAGLRTSNKWAPFPEEINRQTIARVADLHCAPTQSAVDNLLREGIDPESIFLTGNTIVDSLDSIIKTNKLSTQRPIDIESSLKSIVVTIHRRENQGEPLLKILEGLQQIAKEHGEVELIFVLHPNPMVSQPIIELFSDQDHIQLLPAQPYDKFVLLLSQAYLIITDSGGIQEEAPSLKKPVVVLRNETERAESISGGLGVLVGSDAELIRTTIERFLTDSDYYASFVTEENPYGDGQASRRIAKKIAGL